MAKIVAQIKQWSYSRLRDYKKCAQMAKFKYIDKMRDDGSPAMERGNALHTALERFIVGAAKKFEENTNPEFKPYDIERHKNLVLAMRKAYPTGRVHIEQQWAFTKDWVRCDWFAPDVYYRSKMDVAVEATRKIYGYDHKSGRFRPGEYDDQLFQYCIALLLVFPEAEEAVVELLFYDCDVLTPVRKTLKRAFLQQAIERLEREAAPMLADKRFAPTPGQHCMWCPGSKKRGGPCQVG